MAGAFSDGYLVDLLMPAAKSLEYWNQSIDDVGIGVARRLITFAIIW
jgi:hypothetical protein